MTKWDNKKEDCLVFPPKSVSMYYTLSTLNEAQILKLGAEIKIAQGGRKKASHKKKTMPTTRGIYYTGRSATTKWASIQLHFRFPHQLIYSFATIYPSGIGTECEGLSSSR